jgi:tetratricopeptide (TPR) repeat protein
LPSTKNAHFINVISDGQVNRDGQRLTRSDLMWENATHNQLRPIYVDSFDLEIDIVHDVSLRAAAEVERRTTQRNNAMNEMSENALDSDDPSFLLHAAKHALSLDNIDQALKFVEAFRAKAPVHGELSGSRALLALYLAVYYLGKENYEQAEVWALRVLFDGPNIMAMCLLGDIAAMRDDLRSAVGWYSAGCAVDAEHEHIVPIEWHVVLENREERLRELQVAYKESLKDATDSSIPKE